LRCSHARCRRYVCIPFACPVHTLPLRAVGTRLLRTLRFVAVYVVDFTFGRCFCRCYNTPRSGRRVGWIAVPISLPSCALFCRRRFCYTVVLIYAFVTRVVYCGVHGSFSFTCRCVTHCRAFCARTRIRFTVGCLVRCTLRLLLLPDSVRSFVLRFYVGALLFCGYTWERVRSVRYVAV